MKKSIVTALFLTLLLTFQTFADSVACHYVYERIEELENITMNTPNSRQNPVLDVLKNVLARHISGKPITPNSTVDAFLEYLKLIDPYRIFISEEDLTKMKYPQRSFFMFLHSRLRQGIVVPEYRKLYELSQERLNAYVKKFIHESQFRRRVVETADQMIHRADPFDLRSSRPQSISDVESSVVELLAKYLVAIARSKTEKPQRTDRSDLADLIRSMRTEISDYTANIDPTTLNQLVTKSYLKTFDRHTDMFLRSSQTHYLDTTSNEHTVIGIQYQPVHGGFRIDYVAPDSVADKAGIQVNDLIVAIEKQKGSDLWQATSRLTYDKFKSMLWGPEESELRLRVRRQGQEVVYDLTRKTYTPGDRSVESNVVETPAGRVLQLKLNSFSQGTASSLREEINSSIQKEKINGMILDLRGNPGGSVFEFMEILPIFIENASAIIIKDINAQQERRSWSTDKPAWNGPLVVLVDHESASASEGLAAALSAHRRALIVGGPQTFGKGTVQEYMHSKEGALYKYTVAFFFSPDGHPIQWEGAPIDIPLASARDEYFFPERTARGALKPAKLIGKKPKANTTIADLNLITEITRDLSAERMKKHDLSNKSIEEIEALNTEEAMRILTDWINLQ